MVNSAAHAGIHRKWSMDKRTLEHVDVDSDIKRHNLLWIGVIIGFVCTIAALISGVLKYVLAVNFKK